MSNQVESEGVSRPAGDDGGAPEFITPNEAAKLLRLNRKSIYEALKRGEIPGAQRIGRSYRIARDVLIRSFGQTASPKSR